MYIKSGFGRGANEGGFWPLLMDRGSLFDRWRAADRGWIVNKWLSKYIALYFLASLEGESSG